MADTNFVVLVGRLVRDAEMIPTTTGKMVTKFSIAVNKKRKAGNEWKDSPSFFEIVLWGQLGESLHPYLTKGKQVVVTGELNQERWQQNGDNKSKVNVTASTIQLLGGSSNNNSKPSENYTPPPSSGSDYGFVDDIPF